MTLQNNKTRNPVGNVFIAMFVVSILITGISSIQYSLATDTQTSTTVNGTTYTVSGETNGTSTSSSTESETTSTSTESDTELSSSPNSDTLTSVNGTDSSVSTSVEGTSSEVSAFSDSTSISESTTSSDSETASTLSVNGTTTEVSGIADDSCVQISLLSSTSSDGGGIFCLDISMSDGGSISGSGNVTSDPLSTGVESETDSVLPQDTDLLPVDPELGTFVVEKIDSGLIASDPLNNATMTKEELENDNRYWTYGGSALSLFEPDAPVDVSQNSTGRYIGTQTPEPGVYAGYYAVTPSTDAALFHAKITTPIRTIPSDFFQNGLYVQTDNGLINYVTCVSISSQWGTTWHIIRTFGDIDQATFFEVLWSDPGANQPLTRDCTIITNGDNYLKVYLDGSKVYDSNTLDLQMPGPFLYFLEPQNSYADQMLYGIYNDFYITSDETIKVINNPSTAEKVEVLDDSGAILASSQVTEGIAVLDVGKYHFPIDATIRVTDTMGLILAENPASIFGGDIYSVELIIS